MNARWASKPCKTVKQFILSGSAAGLLLVLLTLGISATHADPVAPSASGTITLQDCVTFVNGNVVTHTTWLQSNSPYCVQSGLTVNGGITLTVEPGVEVRFANGAVLAVADSATLMATGMVTQPITFTAATQQPGAWVGLHLAAQARVRLAHCAIGYGGGGNEGALRITGSNVQVKQCRIHHTGRDWAIKLINAGIRPLLEEVEIDHNNGAAIFQETLDMNPIYRRLRIHDNGNNVLYSNNTTIARPVTLDGSPDGLGVPIIQGQWGWLTIAAGGALTLTPGTELRFVGGRLQIDDDGALFAQGTAARPITFTVTAAQPQPGAWDGLRLSPQARVRLAHCAIGYGGGGNEGALRITGSNVQVKQCRIHHTGRDWAIKLINAGIRPLLEEVEIDHNNGAAIFQETLDMNPIYRRLRIHDNGSDAVYVNNTTIAHPVTLDGSPDGLGAPIIQGQWGWLTIAAGGALTLTPGTELRFVGGRLQIDDDGALFAQGTAARPITFTVTAAQPQPGAWDGLRLSPQARVRLAHCAIGYGGGGNEGALRITGSDVQVKHCRIHDTGRDNAIKLLNAGISPLLEEVEVDHNNGTAIYQNTLDMNPIYRRLRIHDNGNNVLYSDNTTIVRPVTLDGSPDGLGVPIIQGQWGWLTIAAGGALTLIPGTELRFGHEIGRLAVEDGGALFAQGTAARPITFTVTAAQPQPGAWDGLRLSPQARVRLAHCAIGYGGGGNEGALRITGSDVQVQHCRIHHTGRDNAIKLFNVGISPLLEEVEIDYNNGTAIFQSTLDMNPLYRRLRIHDNGSNALYVNNTTIAHPVTLDGSPDGLGAPIIQGQWGWLTIAASGALTLTPGTELRFVGGRLQIDDGGALFAEGTAVRPITFTVTAAQPQPGAWDGLRLSSGARASLAYCDVGWGGAGNEGILRITGPGSRIRDCHIHHSASSALRLLSSARIDVTGSRIDANNGPGIELRDSAVVTLTRSSVMLNGGDGIVNYGSNNITLGGAAGEGNSILANGGRGVNQSGAGQALATYNWWGDPSGPYHPTLNPAGKGDAVSDRVIFDPWATAVTGETVTHRLEINLAGPPSASPGSAVSYVVSYVNLTTATVQSAVLVLALPINTSYLESTNDGLYWLQRHQVFWKLGDLAPGAGGATVVRVRYAWGLPFGLEDSALAALEGLNTPKQAFDINEYLNYVPLTVVTQTLMSDAEFDAARQASLDLDALYQAALAQGYEATPAKQLGLNDGRTVVQAGLLQPDLSAATLLIGQGENALAIIIDRTSVTLTTPTGGVHVDPQQGTFEAFGAVNWPTGGLAALLRDGVAGAPSFSARDCLVNCMVENVSVALLGEFIKVLGSLGTIQSCVDYLSTGDSGAAAACLTGLQSKIPGAGTATAIFDCITKSAGDPDHCKCTDNKYECTKLFGYFEQVKKIPCNKSTGLYEPYNAEHFFCALNEKCTPGIGGQPYDHCKACPSPKNVATVTFTQAAERVAACQSWAAGNSIDPLQCTVTTIRPPRDPNAKYGLVGDLLPGQVVSYTIAYENEGEGEAYNVYIIDPLPSQINPASLQIGSNGRYLSTGNKIIWVVGDLPSKGQPGASGVVTFTARLKEGLPGGTVMVNQATVYFPTVPEQTPTNPVINIIGAVVAKPQQLTTGYNQPLTITLQGADSGGASLTFSIVETPEHGQLSGMGATWIYTPLVGFSGPDLFTFRASNGITESRAAEVNILVLTPETDTTAPRVLWTSPAHKAMDVAVRASPVFTDEVSAVYMPWPLARFSETISPTTLSTTTVRLLDGTGHAPALRLSYDGTTDQLTLMPREALRKHTTYTVTLSAGITDLAGNPLESYTWTFRTGPPRRGLYLPLVLRKH